MLFSLSYLLMLDKIRKIKNNKKNRVQILLINAQLRSLINQKISYFKESNLKLSDEINDS